MPFRLSDLSRIYRFAKHFSGSSSSVLNRGFVVEERTENRAPRGLGLFVVYILGLDLCCGENSGCTKNCG